MLLKLLLIASCGGAGAVLRYILGSRIASRFPSVMPYGTLTVNWLGCLAIGLLVGWMDGQDAYRYDEAVLTIGLLGGFTTFSTLTVQLFKMLQWQQIKWFISYLLLSYGIGICLTFAGYQLLSNLI